jgi:hypothetical protein
MVLEADRAIVSVGPPLGSNPKPRPGHAGGLVGEWAERVFFSTQGECIEAKCSVYICLHCAKSFE